MRNDFLAIEMSPDVLQHVFEYADTWNLPIRKALAHFVASGKHYEVRFVTLTEEGTNTKTISVVLKKTWENLPEHGEV